VRGSFSRAIPQSPAFLQLFVHKRVEHHQHPVQGVMIKALLHQALLVVCGKRRKVDPPPRSIPAHGW